MKKIFFFFILFVELAWGANAQVPSARDALSSAVFTANDAVITSGACSYQCRSVAAGYVTRIRSIDAKSGTTVCDVYTTNNLDQPLGVSANQVNTVCRAQANKAPDYTNLASTGANSYSSLATNSYNSSTVTLSKFLAGMVTLDPDMVDFQTTNTTGIMTLVNPGSIYGTNISSMSGDPEYVATADSFNKNNLAYFSNLFVSLSTIYQYLQNGLFVFVGLFFIASLGSDKLIAWLEKRNQGTANKSYLTRFHGTIIAVAFFFIPIPEPAGMHSSIVQNIIRFFVTESVDVADKASGALQQVYFQKLYSSVGAASVEGEATIKSIRDNSATRKAMYASALNGACKDRFRDATTFQVSDEVLQQYETFNYNGASDRITAKACRDIERKFLVESKTNTQYTAYANQVNDSFANNQLQGKLGQINTMLSNRQQELGFVNSALAPSVSIMVDLMPMIDNVEQQNNAAATNQERVHDSIVSEQNTSWWDDILNSGKNMVAGFLGNVAYMILPGAGETYGFLRDVIQNGAATIGVLLMPATGGWSLPVAVGAADMGGSQVFALWGTGKIYEMILNYIPLVVSMIAGIIAITMWVIELLKYFYVTPFVVAFSLTTNRSNRIMNFLVTGISVFFKPILTVMFIYLGIFLYGFINDIFLTLGYEQFDLLNEINESIWVAVILSIVKILIHIVGLIASAYFMWKLILTGPDYVMKMLGVGSTNEYGDMVHGLQGKLDKYSFNM